jgi:DeoD family purine-nucleoside phosphorylase
MTSLNSREDAKGELMQGSLESGAVNHGEPIHLRPTTTLAERVLLPGDPGRALALAQLLLSDPLMFNHHRGLWGYTGTAADGQPLTVQSTGMGGPSAAIVLHELISLGVRRAIRVGTCGGLNPSLGLGDLVLAREAIAADGTSVSLGAGALTRADPPLADALAGALRAVDDRPHHAGRIVSIDVFYDTDDRRQHDWSEQGALAVEMETSTLFALGARARVPVACLLVVSDTFDATGARVRIDDDRLAEAVTAMAGVAAGAFGA